MELKGHKILTSLLNIYSALLKLDFKEFEKLVNDQRIDCYVSQRLIKRLSSKHIVAYKQAVGKISKNNLNRYVIEEWYYRCRLIIDYISGMTDDFALDEYKTLEALK